MPFNGKMCDVLEEMYTWVQVRGPQDWDEKYGVQEFLRSFHEDKPGHVQTLHGLAKKYGWTGEIPLLVRLRYRLWD